MPTGLRPPPLARHLPLTLLRRRPETGLRKQWREHLQLFLDDYRRRLRAWAMQATAELRDRFDALAAPLLTRLEAPAADAAAGERELAADLQRLAELDARGDAHNRAGYDVPEDDAAESLTAPDSLA